MRRCKTRDPGTVNRDPVIVMETERVVAQRKARRYIAASMPTVCPDCGGNTRMADGRHTDPVRRVILEYRTCAHCGARLAAGRAMTPFEAARYCGHAEAVAEYEREATGSRE